MKTQLSKPDRERTSYTEGYKQATIPYACFFILSFDVISCEAIREMPDWPISACLQLAVLLHTAKSNHQRSRQNGRKSYV